MSVEQALPVPSRRARAEASAWIAKLHGPERSPELERDFRGWLDADAEHARAFEHVTDVWESIGRVNVGGLPRLAAARAFEPCSPRRWLSLAAAACALVVIGAAAWLVLAAESYETRIGEQRIVTLDDGSRLHLNSATRLDVDLTDDVRRIDLEHGEAYFEVAKDQTRPFIVRAGVRYVTALGTAFAIRLDEHRVAVTLVEGKVTVTSTPDAAALAERGLSSASPGSGALILEPGERVTVAQGGSVVIDTPRAEATAAWRRGEVVLDETSLAAAVEELNRYQRQQLVIADPSLRQLPVSGIYRIGDNQDFARAVALLYGLDVIEQQGEDIQLRRR